MRDKSDKELKKLSRSQLLEILSEQSREIERLKEKIVTEDSDAFQGDESTPLPEASDVSKELDRLRYKKTYRRTLRSTVGALIVVAALAILVASLWLPVLQIYGNSMTPTLNSGEIVVSLKSNQIEQGDIIAFYYNNKVLIKRVIAKSGDWVDIAKDGTVSVNGEVLEEPYVYEKSYGECDLTFPYQVPEDRVFVLGDHRSVSVDSRSSSMGCVAEEQIVGKLVFRIWPLKRFHKF
jgi:signal peptidase I